jgi:hypothetical protein
MLRNTFLSVLTCLALATVSQAAVTIESTSVDTPGLTGFKTWTVTAVSTDPITAFDFVGDGSNDSATGRGFFGPLSQVGLPTGPTIFEDGNVLIPIVGTPAGSQIAHDSQFKVLSSAVVVPPGLAEESATLLQATWAWSAAQGTSVPFAQITTNGTVNFRGAVTALVNGVQTDFPVSGTLGGQAGVAPVVVDAAIGDRIQGNQVSHQFTTSAGSPAPTWGSLTPVAGNPTPATPPTLTAGGLFTWDSRQSPYGSYAWDVTATNATGSDVGRLSITLIVPEPATISLVGLMLVGLVSLGARKR